jgi:transcription elongation factor GreA
MPSDRYFFVRCAPKGERKKDCSMNKVPMTIGGFATLKEELRWRQQEERPRIIEAISEARSHGDLSENAEYHAAKEQQSLNEGRVNELEDFIARAEVIDVSKLSGDKIKFGATVELVDEDTEETKRYQIVGDQEADVKSGRISISSPIARALIGKEVGDAIEVNAPGGARGYEIVKVQFV